MINYFLLTDEQTAFYVVPTSQNGASNGLPGNDLQSFELAKCLYCLIYYVFLNTWLSADLNPVSPTNFLSCNFESVSNPNKCK